jgi:hypothetical protein
MSKDQQMRMNRMLYVKQKKFLSVMYIDPNQKEISKKNVVKKLVMLDYTKNKGDKVNPINF